MCYTPTQTKYKTMRTLLKQPTQILVFNPLKRLVAVFNSLSGTASAFDVRPQSIHYACSGKCITCNNLYFRQNKGVVTVTFEDLGKLKLQDYDRLCGVERKYYKTAKITRKGMKYNKH